MHYIYERWAETAVKSCFNKKLKPVIVSKYLEFLVVQNTYKKTSSWILEEVEIESITC